MKRVLIPLPATDFDPTEAGVPFVALKEAGHRVVFATPKAQMASADTVMLTGEGLGPAKSFLVADERGQGAFAAMKDSAEFQKPQAWTDILASDFDAILLPGGHAPGMREYLESQLLQQLVVQFFAADKIVAAICHGTVLAARSRDSEGRSLLHGRKTTGLTRSMELSAWLLTKAFKGDYYRTYPETVQAEVTRALAAPGDFETGPLALRRDAPDQLGRGFVVRDRKYLSARWPGDAHRFADELLKLLA